MHAASHAKIAKGAKKDRFTVASELVSDGVTAFATIVSRHVNVGDKLRRYIGALCVMRAASHAKNAKSAKNCNEKNKGF